MSGWAWEGWAVLCFTALVVGDRAAWHRCPWWMAGATLSWVVGLWPVLDALARHSITLHAVQSVLIHHVAPWCMWRAQVNGPWHRLWQGLGGRPTARSAGWAWLAFAAMSALWVWPELHLALMTNAVFYSGMKWAMALTGLWLCHALTGPSGACTARPAAHQLGLAMAVPQVVTGLYLMCSTLLYLMPACVAVDEGWQGELLQWVSQWHPLHDQRAGGVLLVAAAVIFYVWDVRRRHPAAEPVAPHFLSERVL